MTFDPGRGSLIFYISELPGVTARLPVCSNAMRFHLACCRTCPGVVQRPETEILWFTWPKRYLCSNDCDLTVSSSRGVSRLQICTSVLFMPRSVRASDRRLGAIRRWPSSDHHMIDHIHSVRKTKHSMNWNLEFLVVCANGSVDVKRNISHDWKFLCEGTFQCLQGSVYFNWNISFK